MLTARSSDASKSVVHGRYRSLRARQERTQKIEQRQSASPQSAAGQEGYVPAVGTPAQ